MKDLRQSEGWGKYLSKIGWEVADVDGVKAYIKNILFLNCSVIKIQRAKNPLPFKNIDTLAKDKKALFVITEPEIENFKEKNFRDHDFMKAENMTLTHTSTIRIDLTPPINKIFASFSENAKRNIKKALKNNLKIEVIYLKKEDDDKQFKKFYNLLQTLSKNKKFWVPDYTEYFHKMNAFKDSLLFFAYQKNDPHPLASIWILLFDKRAWYTQTGATQRGYDLLANYLLVWGAIKVCKKRKINQLDFEGIYDPRFPKERKRWKNFTEFKKRFHGQVMEYPTPFIKIYNPLFKVFFMIVKQLEKVF